MRRLIVLVLLAATSCGGGSSSGGTSAPASTDQRSALITAVRAYSDAFLGGHGAEAYSMLSRRCQADNNPKRFVDLVRGANILYGDETIKTLTVDSIDGSVATVTYLYGNRNVDERDQRWLLEDGTWRWDAC